MIIFTCFFVRSSDTRYSILLNFGGFVPLELLDDSPPDVFRNLEVFVLPRLVAHEHTHLLHLRLDVLVEIGVLHLALLIVQACAIVAVV